MEPRKKKKKKTWRESAPIDMFLSAVSVLVVVQLSSEVPEGLTNYPVYMYGMSNTKLINCVRLQTGAINFVLSTAFIMATKPTNPSSKTISTVSQR
jgi:hypothetical protein